MKKPPPPSKRWRCLSTGCNPVLTKDLADQHQKATGHRVAKWPIRSAAGEAKARQRNRSGYYDRYNVGAKSATARGLRAPRSSFEPMYRLPMIQMLDGSFQESDAHEHGDHPREGER